MCPQLCIGGLTGFDICMVLQGAFVGLGQRWSDCMPFGTHINLSIAMPPKYGRDP